MLKNGCINALYQKREGTESKSFEQLLRLTSARNKPELPPGIPAEFENNVRK